MHVTQVLALLVLEDAQKVTCIDLEMCPQTFAHE